MAGVTADTNIYVSGYEFGGLPRRFLDLATAGAFRLDISDAILTETLRILREKFQWSKEELQAVHSDMLTYTQYTTPIQALTVVAADPDDDRVVECAVAAGSQFIVTGDNDLLQLGNYGDIRIVRVAEFLRLMQIPGTS